jgi:hypothetical protein
VALPEIGLLERPEVLGGLAVVRAEVEDAGPGADSLCDIAAWLGDFGEVPAREVGVDAFDEAIELRGTAKGQKVAETMLGVGEVAQDLVHEAPAGAELGVIGVVRQPGAAGEKGLVELAEGLVAAGDLRRERWGSRRD